MDTQTTEMSKSLLGLLDALWILLIEQLELRSTIVTLANMDALSVKLN